MPRQRRMLLRALIGVAVLLVSTLGAGVYAHALDSSAATIRVDYETGTKNSGYSEIGFNECCSHSLRTTDLARTGGHAIRSYLKYGDPMVVGGARAESHTVKMEDSYFDSGDTAYYGFSIYVPSTWQTDIREDIVFQWHNWRDKCDEVSAPTAFLNIMPAGQFRLRVNSDANRCSTSASIDKTSFDLTDVKTGQWNDFVFKFDWNYGKSGAIQAWHQASKNPGWTKVLNTTGPNTFNNDSTTHGYLKWGIYKPAWNTISTVVSARMLIHDNIAIGNSFSDVNPSK